MGLIVLLCRTACTELLAWRRTLGSRSALHLATHAMASRHQAAQLPEGTYVQQGTTKSNMNRERHKRGYKTLEKGIRLHKGTSAQQEQWVKCPTSNKGHNSYGVTDM